MQRRRNYRADWRSARSRGWAGRVAQLPEARSGPDPSQATGRRARALGRRRRRTWGTRTWGWRGRGRMRLVLAR